MDVWAGCIFSEDKTGIFSQNAWGGLLMRDEVQAAAGPLLGISLSGTSRDARSPASLCWNRNRPFLDETMEILRYVP